MEIEYISYYYKVLLVIFSFVILSFFQNKRNIDSKLHRILSFIALVFTINYLGSRDFLVGVDTLNYKDIYETFSVSSRPLFKFDVLFYYPFFYLSKIVSYRFVLYLCSFCYVFFAYKAFKNFSSSHYIYWMMFFFIYPYFFQFGINGMRNGIGASVFLYGLSRIYMSKRNGIYILLLSCCIHISMIVPFLSFLFCKWIKSLYIILFIWLFFVFFIFLGLKLPIGELSQFFLLEDVRLSSYLKIESVNISRELLNYLLYGIPIVLWGGINILSIKMQNDVFYKTMYSMYLLSAIFYLIMIYAPYPVRFAYLSDFMMPIIVCYPLYRSFMKNENIKKMEILSFMFFLIVTIIKI